MAQKSQQSVRQEADLLEKVKIWAVQAMFSDDELLDELVLKGGNAMALVHRLSARASVDLDFSIRHEFADGIEATKNRIEKTLKRTFQGHRFEVFDLKMEEKPRGLTEDMAGFWGGYFIEFKLIQDDLYEKYAADIESMRRYALKIGQGQKFLIDISKFEYVDLKEERDFDGYRIYVYSPEMIVCEKLRAICQQMTEYGPIIKRSRPSTPRARDFVDIHVLVSTLNLTMTTEKVRTMLTKMFEIKHVPLALLGHLHAYRDFHRTDFPAVQATMAAGFPLQEYDFYFEYTADLVEQLKPFWNV